MADSGFLRQSEYGNWTATGDDVLIDETSLYR